MKDFPRFLLCALIEGVALVILIAVANPSVYVCTKLLRLREWLEA